MAKKDLFGGVNECNEGVMSVTWLLVGRTKSSKMFSCLLRLSTGLYLASCAFLKAGIFWVESQFEKIRKNKTFA